MPYVTQEVRDRWNEEIQRRWKITFEHEPPGTLNYVITKTVNDWMLDKGGVSYTIVNEVIGVLECLKFEILRRVLSPYEDRKCHENGDVFFVPADPFSLPSR